VRLPPSSAGFVVGKLHDGSAVPMTAAIAAAGWRVFLVYWGMVRGLSGGART